MTLMDTDTLLNEISTTNHSKNSQGSSTHTPQVISTSMNAKQKESVTTPQINTSHAFLWASNKVGLSTLQGMSGV